MTDYVTGPGQTSNGLVLNNGDTQFVGSSTATSPTTALANATQVNAGATQDIREGTATGTTVFQNGTVDVLDGGTVHDISIDGGLLYLNAPDAVASSVSLGDYGRVEVAAGTLKDVDIYQKGFVTIDMDLGDNLTGSLDSATNVYTVTGSKGVYSLQLDSTPDRAISLTSNGTSFTISEVCFCRGTRLLTSEGEVAVEHIRPGDTVITLGGGRRRVGWVGSSIGSARGQARIVVIKANAFSDGVPARDLRVTPGHSFLFGEVLIPAGELINYRSIVQAPADDDVEVFHIELERHDVLLAEGAPAESYRDDGNRRCFQKSCGAGVPQVPFAPVLTSGAVVDRVWQELSARAGAPEGLTHDPDIHLLIDGRRVEARRVSANQFSFPIADASSEIRLASRAAVPAAVGLARDQRSLGVALCRASLRGASSAQHLAFYSDDLHEGFHEAESTGGFRWTDGAGRLPFQPVSSPATLTIELGCTAVYAPL